MTVFGGYDFQLSRQDFDEWSLNRDYKLALVTNDLFNEFADIDSAVETHLI